VTFPSSLGGFECVEAVLMRLGKVTEKRDDRLCRWFSSFGAGQAAARKRGPGPMTTPAISGHNGGGRPPGRSSPAGSAEPEHRLKNSTVVLQSQTAPSCRYGALHYPPQGEALDRPDRSLGDEPAPVQSCSGGRGRTEPDGTPSTGLAEENLSPRFSLSVANCGSSGRRGQLRRGRETNMFCICAMWDT